MNLHKEDKWLKNFLIVQQVVTFDCLVITHKITNRLCPKDIRISFNADLIVLITILGFVWVFKCQSLILNIPKRDFRTKLRSLKVRSR